MQSLTNGKDAVGGGPTADECARRVLDVAPPIVRAIRKLMRDHRLQDLSVPQFRAMGLLSYSPRASLSCVADHIGSSLPAASRMIDALVAKGLVARQECRDDRRQVSLALTRRGQSAFRQSRQATRRQLARHLAALPLPRRQEVMAAMKCLGDIFGSDAQSDAPPRAAAKSPPPVRH